jgi:hypothetical protein
MKMAYSAAIDRTNPTAFVFLIDQSGSTDERMETGETKAKFVSDVLNNTIYQLIIRCTRSEGVRNYFDVGVLAYNGNGVSSGFAGGLIGDSLHQISSLEAQPLRIEDRRRRVPDGAGGLVEETVRFPIWFDPVSLGGTPMCGGFRKTAEILASWCDGHMSSYPPTIITLPMANRRTEILSNWPKRFEK